MMTTSLAHAEHSPSSLKYKEICPGWESQQDDERFQALADEGTIMHAAAESGDLSALNVEQRHFVQNVNEYVARFAGAATKTIKEERVYANDPLLREKTHGTPDRLDFMSEDFVHLTDFKFGRRPVDHASRNIQGFAYAIAVFDTYPAVQFVHVHFLAPRIADGFTNHLFERGLDYDRMLLRVKRVVERANKFGADWRSYVPDFEACLYCGKRATCEALSLAINQVYENTGDPIVAHDMALALSALGKENEDELSYNFKLAKVVKAWAEAYEQYTLNKHLNEGINVKGYELRFRKGRVTVEDTPKAAQILTEEKFLPVDALLRACDLNIKKLEAVLTEGVEEDKIPEIRKLLLASLAKAGVLKTGEESQYLYKLSREKV